MKQGHNVSVTWFLVPGWQLCLTSWNPGKVAISPPPVALLCVLRDEQEEAFLSVPGHCACCLWSRVPLRPDCFPLLWFLVLVLGLVPSLNAWKVALIHPFSKGLCPGWLTACSCFCSQPSYERQEHCFQKTVCIITANCSFP
jgi:hypothetical protein